MTDITERLRSRQWPHQGDAKHWALRDEAADELDRLRAELADLKIERDILRRDNDNHRASVHSCHAGCTRAGCVNERLRAALREAAESIESWGTYASPYFQEKHGLAGDIVAARAALGE